VTDRPYSRYRADTDVSQSILHGDRNDNVVSDLLTNVDSGPPSLLSSLDISAAFDTLITNDYCNELKTFGFTGEHSAHLVVKIKFIGP